MQPKLHAIVTAADTSGSNLKHALDPELQIELIEVDRTSSFCLQYVPQLVVTYTLDG